MMRYGASGSTQQAIIVHSNITSQTVYGSDERVTESQLGVWIDPRSPPAPDALERVRACAWPMLAAPPPDALHLQLDGAGLALVLPRKHGDVVVRGDFNAGLQGRRLRQIGHRREALARACGLGREEGLHVVDATAGLGRDSALLAALGARVTAIERHPVVAALLVDALVRASDDTPLGRRLASIRVMRAEAIEWLEGPCANTADVIYLDPMFANSGTAAAGKDMQLLRRLLGESPDPAPLLEIARSRAKSRVVVKRHRRAPPLAGATPEFRTDGRSTRFDVYLKIQPPPPKR